MGYKRRNITKKQKGGSSCGISACQIPQTGGSSESRLGVLFPRFGGAKGGACGCGSTPPKLPNSELLRGGACPCQQVPQIPTPLSGGYRATKRNKEYLKKWKRGIPIGFTLISSLKSKGLLPRKDGTRRISPKYRK
jgi:hypothetical protein